MIIFKKGNLFDSDCQTLVNTVNCYGVMGKGIAKQFKQRFPEMFDTYRYICKNNTRENHLSHGGDIWIWDYVEMYKHKKILCFATKEMWQFPSRIEWIERGLANFVNNYKKWNIESIAWPKLGCTNGKLDWNTQVKPLMVKYLDDIDILNEIYE